MTNREIFKRLQNIREYARVTDTWPHDNAAQQNLHLRNAVEAIAKDLGDLLLDLAAPVEHFADAGKMMREEDGDKAWYNICPWRIRGKNNIGLECSPLLCSQCVRKPEPQKTSYPGGEKIVDPTGKNPTFYKCPFCSAFTITQNGTTCITGDPEGKCSQCGKVFMLLGERKEVEK